jgi:hypothetical protein
MSRPRVTRQATPRAESRDTLAVWFGANEVGRLFHQRGVYSFAYDAAQAIVQKIRQTVRTSRHQAPDVGLSPSEMARLAGAFGAAQR